MECKLYTNSVFLTLKNKLALLKSFIQTTKLPACKTALMAISEEFKNKLDETTNKINELGEKFVESLEEINNNFSAEFKKQAQTLLAEQMNSQLIGCTENSPAIRRNRKRTDSYDKNKFSSNRQWHHDCQNPICSVFNQIKSHIESMIGYYSSRKSPESTENQIKINDVKQKLSLMEIILDDIPKLGFNEYELTIISNTMKKALKHSRQINSNIKAAQTITIEEVSNLDIEKIQSKNRTQIIHKSNPDKKRNYGSLKDFPGYTQNHEEYEKILKGCNYIAEELAEIKNNQFTLESLMTDFIKKDEILEKLKKNTSIISENAGPRVKPTIIKKEDDWPRASSGWYDGQGENSSFISKSKKKEKPDKETDDPENLMPDWKNYIGNRWVGSANGWLKEQEKWKKHKYHYLDYSPYPELNDPDNRIIEGELNEDKWDCDFHNDRITKVNFLGIKMSYGAAKNLCDMSSGHEKSAYEVYGGITVQEAEKLFLEELIRHKKAQLKYNSEHNFVDSRIGKKLAELKEELKKLKGDNDYWPYSDEEEAREAEEAEPKTSPRLFQNIDI